MELLKFFLIASGIVAWLLAIWIFICSDLFFKIVRYLKAVVIMPYRWLQYIVLPIGNVRYAYTFITLHPEYQKYSKDWEFIIMLWILRKRLGIKSPKDITKS